VSTSTSCSVSSPGVALSVVAATAAAAAAAGATPGGRGANVFALFTKAHFADVKRSLPAGTPHKEVMVHLAARYRLHKAAMPAAAAPAAAVEPAAHACAEVIDLVSPPADAGADSEGSWGTDADQQQQGADGSDSLLGFMDRLALC
jgi:hypothetical protein